MTLKASHLFPRPIFPDCTPTMSPLFLPIAIDEGVRGVCTCVDQRLLFIEYFYFLEISN